MSTGDIPVDLFNPGQVFACLGLIEAAELLVGRTEAEFDWEDAGGTRFRLAVSGNSDPITDVLEFLAEAQVSVLIPSGSEFDLGMWRLSAECVPEAPDPTRFPQAEPRKPAALPAVLRAGGRTIVIDAWSDASSRDNVKFWGGARGRPGAGIVRDALHAARTFFDDARPDPFAVGAPMSSGLGFDWRRDYVPLRIGFSLNEHGKIQPRGYPLVEVLAAIGLTHARPRRPEPRNKLVFDYAVVGGEAFPATVHRAALGDAALPFPMRRFRMNLAWPGQENKARCITSVTETPT